MTGASEAMKGTPRQPEPDANGAVEQPAALAMAADAADASVAHYRRAGALGKRVRAYRDSQ